MAPLVAVLGASRFLGRLAIPLFAAEGWRVRALDRRQAAIAGMLGVERDWADPLDERSLTRATTDCTCVLDLSSSEGGPEAVAVAEAALLAGNAGRVIRIERLGAADRRARGRSRPRHGRALRARDRRRLALGGAAARARRPPAGDPVPGLDAARDRAGGGRRRRARAGLAGGRRRARSERLRPGGRGPHDLPRAARARWRPRTAGGRGWSTPASRATWSRASRSASPRAASPRSRRSRRPCPAPESVARGDSLLRLADLPITPLAAAIRAAAAGGRRRGI